MIRIRVRDGGLATVGEVDGWDDLTVIVRHLAVGAWSFTVPASPRAMGLLAAGNGVRIDRDGRPLMSGPIRSLVRSWGGQDGGGPGVLTVAGADDMCWLAERVCYPDPANPADSQLDAYDTRSGPAETLIRHYVDVNAGPGALPSRRVPGLTVAASAGLGGQVAGNARFDNLLELVGSLGSAGNVAVRVVDVGGALELAVAEPADRSAQAVFSRARGNLRSYSYGLAAPFGTVALVGGQGQGAARTIVEVSTGDGGWGMRAEAFADRRDTDDAAQLMQAGQDALAQSGPAASLAIEPIDLPALAYGRDYQVGDVVSVLVDDTTVVDVLREVKIGWSAREGETITPQVGTAGASSTPALYGRVADVARRVGLLERRQ